jgi:hypothetical protein
MYHIVVMSATHSCTRETLACWKYLSCHALGHFFELSGSGRGDARQGGVVLFTKPADLLAPFTVQGLHGSIMVTN